jgi:hypothetical protein
MVVSCEQIWREISNYLDDDVEGPMRSVMEEHFRSCTKCAAVLDGMRNVVLLYGDERMIEVPAGFGRRLERRLARDVRASRNAWPGWLVAAAAAVLLVAGLRLASSFAFDHSLKSQHAQPAQGIPPDMTVVVTAGSKLFHAPGCDFIHNKDKERTLTAKEAMREGYVPCLRCLRKYLDVAAMQRALADNVIEAENELNDQEIRQARH